MLPRRLSSIVHGIHYAFTSYSRGLLHTLSGCICMLRLRFDAQYTLCACLMINEHGGRFQPAIAAACLEEVTLQVEDEPCGVHVTV